MPKVDTSVESLVAQIKSGELRLPEMQRRYVWPATRVRDLLDSLYRGYPSGTILVWETDREMPSRDLAVVQAANPFQGHKLLLDGQQRLTSLSAILNGEPVTVRGRKKPIDILFNLDHPDTPDHAEVDDDASEADDSEPDLDEEEDESSLTERLKLRTFVVASKALLADPHWISVSDVFKRESVDAQLLKRLVKSFDDPNFDKYSKRLQAIRKIRDYPYVVHVLDKQLSYEEVADIFVRVNSLGMKLRGSDLALAQITSRWKDSLKLFERFQEEIEANTWFTLDLGMLVRALVVFTTNQSRFKTAGTIPIGDLKAGWPKAENAIRFAVNFLRANAGIEDESLLSSPLFVITLGYYAMRRDQHLSPAEETALRRWLYVANARGHYSGSTETILDSDLGVIHRGGSPADLTKALEMQFGRLTIEPEDLAGRGKRSSLLAMAYLALKARGAKDWQSHLALSLTHQGREHFVQYHHIFPKALLKKTNEKATIHEIANMAFITGGTNRSLATTPPEKYLASVLNEQGAAALEAHCVPLDPSLWKIEAYAQFLEYRRDALAKAINDFIQGETGALKIDVLLDGGESDSVEFKSSARWDYVENRTNKALEVAIVKTIAGFLNRAGGNLFIGLADDGKIIGLEQDYKTLSKRPDRDGYQQFLVNLVSDAMGKAVCASLSISFHPIEGKEICLIRAQASPTPVYVKDNQQTRFYLRAGNTTQELSTKESVDYTKTRWSKS
jgi:hypothetical protein